MKREKLVAIFGFIGSLGFGSLIIIDVIISDMENPLTAYQTYIGIAILFFSTIFLYNILQKKKRWKK